MPTGTRWTPQQRAEAVGRALLIGANGAADELGIPRRTISSWLLHEHGMEASEYAELYANSRDDLRAILLEAAQAGLQEVLKTLHDPGVPAKRKAKILEILVRAEQTLEIGRAWQGVTEFIDKT